jgi:hypothetical protein
VANWPATREQLITSGYNLPPIGMTVTCNGETCTARIAWASTPSGRMMPLTVTPRPGQPTLYNPHFADCPNAKDFRRKGAAK